VLKERQTVEDLKVPAPRAPRPASRRARALSARAGQESLDTVTAALERMAASPARRPPVIYFDGLGDNIGGWQVCAQSKKHRAQSTEHRAQSTKHKNSAVRGAVRAGPAGCVSTGSRGAAVRTAGRRTRGGGGGRTRGKGARSWLWCSRGLCT
jgi:hypothetical protein